MLLTKKLKYDPPNLRMAGVELKLVEEIKLLGLIIDNKLTFKSHVTASCKKAADIYKQLACTAKVTWGLNTEITRTIYVAVIEPIMTYASSVWAQSTEMEMVKKQLNTLQRGFAQKVCKAYRTVSLTSALALSGLLPLDLRIQEASNLYKAKKGISQSYLPPNSQLEQPIPFQKQPHPSTLTVTEYTLLENENHQTTCSEIYTDGSKIEEKVGAALTWWSEGKELTNNTFGLHPACTVFQSELYALSRATQMVKSSREQTVHILSDSRSSLDLLRNPKASHPLAKAIKEDIKEIREEGRQVNLIWLRAHVGTAGNERADELAKSAALGETSYGYDKIPLSYAKRKIREESIRKWQDRYVTSGTGSVTKVFLPDVEKAYRLTRQTKWTPTQVQALTGHGGIADYLFRFKIKDSPACECDPDVNETVWHLITECPRYSVARLDAEALMDTKLVKSELPSIMADNKRRPYLLDFIEKIFHAAAVRNKTNNMQPQTTGIRVEETTAPSRASTTDGNTLGNGLEASAVQHGTCVVPKHCILAQGEPGTPGIRTRTVAFYMDNNAERLGISFCNAQSKNRVAISPGLACLLNGSTTKVTMKRKTFDAMPEVTVADHKCRLVRSNNKLIMLLAWGERTPFAQACSLLARLGESKSDSEQTSRVISVDAMAIEYNKGEITDLIGCLKASEHHEVVVYENRGEDLSFLRVPKDKRDNQLPSTSTQSGSERLQDKIASQKTLESQKHRISTEKEKERIRKTSAMLNSLGKSLKSIPERIKRLNKGDKTMSRQQTAVEAFFRNNPLVSKPQSQCRTRADKGQVEPPKLLQATNIREHMQNAFLEFLSVTRETLKVNRVTCENILQAYQHGNIGLLKVRLEEADAAIYNNNTCKVLQGDMSKHMAAYNATTGFVRLDEEESQRTGLQKFSAPSEDPIVVTTRHTKVMLDDRILNTAEAIPESWEEWNVPSMAWINGVPGCGKSSWVVAQFDAGQDIVVTTTCEAANDLKDKLSQRLGAEASRRVRTMASILVNGFKELASRLIVDEALMNHFGAIVMAARLTKVTEIVLIGDINQLPYIERENLFKLHYHRPDLITTVSDELLCTHRNPMDVAYALSEVYSGIYSSKSQVHSLQLKSYTGAQIQNTSPNTLFLVHTQAEKEALIAKGYGSGEGSRTLTIHEAQGQTYASVVIIQTKPRKHALHDSVPHAVVAVSRHTGSCVYYTDVREDAICRFVRRAMDARTRTIMEYNLKKAIQHRNAAVVESLAKNIMNEPEF